MNIMNMGNMPTLLLLVLMISTIVATTGMAASPSREELAAAKQWATTHLGSREAALPFSFVYDGKLSSELLTQWEFK